VYYLVGVEIVEVEAAVLAVNVGHLIVTNGTLFRSYATGARRRVSVNRGRTATRP